MKYLVLFAALLLALPAHAGPHKKTDPQKSSDPQTLLYFNSPAYTGLINDFLITANPFDIANCSELTKSAEAGANKLEITAPLTFTGTNTPHPDSGAWEQSFALDGCGKSFKFTVTGTAMDNAAPVVKLKAQ